MKIVVINAHFPNYEPLARLTTYGNRTEYCKRHGYTLRVQTDGFKLPALHPVTYSRLRFLLDTLEKEPFDWAYCSGTDTLHTNFNITLESLTDPAFHVVASCEWCSPFQADSFLVRNSAAGKNWIKTILSLYGNYRDDVWVEQKAIVDTLPSFEKIVKLLPQRAMNSYDYSLYRDKYSDKEKAVKGIDWQGHSGQWQPGDFLIHWPDTLLVERLALVAKYLPLVVK